jgi:hypothetical protein
MHPKIDDLVDLYQIGQPLSLPLLSLVDDEVFIKDVYLLATQAIIRAKQYALDQRETALVVMAMTLIGINYYDNRYWDHVEAELEVLFSGLYGGSQSIQNTIRSVLKIALKEAIGATDLRQIYLPLMEGIITRQTFEGFLKLMYDVFQLNFSFQYDPQDPELKSQLKIVFQSLKQLIRMQSIDDQQDGQDQTEIYVGGSKKTYALSRYTQGAIFYQERFRDALDDLAMVVLNQIHHWYWDIPLRKSGGMLETLFLEWANQQSNKTKAGNLEQKKEQIELKQKPIWRLSLETFEVFLQPKTLNVSKDHFVSQETKILIDNQGKLELTIDDFSLRDIMGGYEITCNRIHITNPFPLVHYQIKTGDAMLYDSADKLHRDILFFDLNGKEVSPTRDFSGDIIVVAPKLDHPHMTMLMETAHYQVGQMTILPGQGMVNQGIFYPFSSVMKPGITGSLVSEVRAFFKENLLPVYKDIHYVLIEKSQVDDVVMVLNGKDITRQCRLEVITSSGKEMLKIFLPFLQAELHHLIVRTVTSSPTVYFNETFIIDAKFNLSWIRNGQGHLTHSFTENQMSLNLIAGTNHTLYSFQTSRGSTVLYCLYHDQLMYRLGDFWEFHSSPIQKHHVRQETILSIFSLIPITTIQLKTINERLLFGTIKLKVHGPNEYICPLGFSIQWPQDEDELLIECYHHDQLIKTIHYIDKNAIDFKASVFDFDDKFLEIKLQFNGIYPMKVQLWDREMMVYQHELLQSGGLRLPNLKPFKKYQVKLLEVRKKFQDPKEVYQTFVQWIDQKAMSGQVFKISHVGYMIFGLKNGKKYQVIKELKTYSINPVPRVALYLQKQLEKDLFEGYLVTKDINGKWVKYLTAKLTISIETYKAGDQGMWVNVLDDGQDELLIDYQRNRILKVDNHPTASPIERIYVVFI